MPRMKISYVSWNLAALLMSATLLLAGCANNISTEDCKELDWQEAGRKDGARGIPSRPPIELAVACNKAGVTLDVTPYQTGWNEGILDFCSAKGGWREGAEGNLDKANACKGQDGETEFTRYFALGQERFRLYGIRRTNAAELRRLTDLESKTRNPIERKAIREQLRALELEQMKLIRQLGQQSRQSPG